jgi:hypothetical protein
MAVPYTFGSATTSIPLSQLDSNFATTITLGNTAIQLGNTVTTLNNMTLGNVTISSGTSNLQTNVANATGVLIEANGGTGTTIGYNGFKSRIINGAMVFDQRNAGASVTATGSNYSLDRWQMLASVSSKFTVQQSSTAPSGFTKSLLVTSSAATSLGATDYYLITQKIEGFNIADLGWGAAGASSITVSFWVRSSLTGTFGFVARNGAGNRCYPASYTISSANTFEYKTVTIAGDTTGTWSTDNSIGIELDFGLGVGSTFSNTAGTWTTGGLGTTGATSVVGTNGATFYITGVQLEKGSTATSFDYRPYGTELALCQRYYETGSGYFNGLNPSFGNNNPIGPLAGTNFQVTKRATPTITLGTATTTLCYTNSGSTNNVNTQSFAQILLVLTGGATSSMSITQPWTAEIEL